MRRQVAAFAVILSAAIAGGLTPSYLAFGQAASPDDHAIFCLSFVPNEKATWQAGKPLAKWASQNPLERDRWDAFQAEICSGGAPAPPSMVSSHGLAIRAAGEMALPESTPTTTTSTTSPTTTTTTTTTTQPPPSGQAIPSSGVISAGGVYTGTYTGTLKISTTDPVTISNAVLTNTSGGALVDAAAAGAVQVTLDHVTGRGGASPQTSGRFFIARNYKSVTIRNCTLEYTRGIELTWGVAGSSVLITRNRHRNIQGAGTSPVGNFVQFREVQNATIEVSWNEILNEYNQSNPEDIISLFKTANAKVHDNYLQHNSKPGNAYNTSTQGTITLDRFDNIGPIVHDNEIYDNQMVDTVNGVAISGGGSQNNYIHDNRLIQDGKLPDGVTQMGNGWSGWYMAAGSGNRMERNVSGYVNRDGNRMDWDSGTDPVKNTTLPSPITRQMELDEWTRWQTKLAAAGVTVGAS